MVRKYIKKSAKCSWHEGDMQLAINSVVAGNSCKFSAKKFGVPRSTLQKKLLESNVNNIKRQSEKNVYHRTFNEMQEKALISYILEMEEKLLGLTGKDIRHIAFQFAEKLHIPHNFNRSKELAGKDWLSNFMRRHNFTHRKPEHTSSNRANAFNEATVTEFFSLLESLMDKYKFTADRIYNVDETGISIVPKKSPKVVARKGRKQVGGLVAAERGESVTAVICLSAGGQYMPPMLIFPRVRVQPLYLNDMPPGAWAEFHKSGYMQTEIFTRWVEKFIQFSRASVENPVLLLLDGHATHVKNLDVIDLAKKNGVEILCFPPHCTHKMQPCDTSFNAPLSHYFGEEVTRLQKLQIKVTMCNLFSVFGKAFIRTAKMETAINAFKSTGIYPCNKEMFLSKHFNSVDENCMSSKHSKDPDENVEKFINIIKEITGGTNKVDVVKCNRDSLSNTEINITNQNSKNINNIDINVTKDNTVNINDSELSVPRCDAENTNSIDINIIDNINNSEISNTISNLQINNHGSESSNQHSEITIPFDYVLQAAPLIHHLSNSLRTYSNVTENIPIVPKNKRQKKGKAAIITSDEYHKDLITEKTKNIKKEKNNDTVKKVKGKKNDKIPNSPTVQLRKRPHSIEEMVVAKRKPLVALNTNSNHSNTVLHTSLENCPSFNNPSLSAYNTLQMSNFSESFINLLPIEIIP